MAAYPFKFIPRYKERIWGARKLETVFGRVLPPGKKIGESWDLVDLPDDASVIANGRYRGQTLARAVRAEGENLTGRPGFASPFPLLVKLLDCAEILSVQVHPDEAACRRLGKGLPKTECWYVIQADPGAFVYKGLAPGVTRPAFERAVKEGAVEALLNRVPVRAGECHLLPAGTLHAIGPGLLLAEIQTPSDTTFRVFDWNRTDERGQVRPLHVPEALESIRFNAPRGELTVRIEGLLADCPHFRIEKETVEPDRAMRITSGAMRILVILAGRGEIRGGDEPVAFRAGDTVLIPAALTGELAATERLELLTVTI